MNFLLFNYELGINFSSNEIIKPNTMGGKRVRLLIAVWLS